tara:strand:- start:324 stop:695 length:372 start_codon:yes stop_codon:yes gene_type:complete
MKQFITLLLFLVSFILVGQDRKVGFATDLEDIYGTFRNFDGTQTLQMYYSEEGDSFKRVSNKVTVEGKFTIEGKYLYVQKFNDEYRLLFFLKGIQLIVMKPDSEGGPGEAWLFTKISSYTDRD